MVQHVVPTVSLMLGHSGIEVTERKYTHLMPHTLDRMTERLDATYRAHTAAPVEVAQVVLSGRSVAG